MKILGTNCRSYAVAAANHVHTKCKLVNGVYVITLDSPNVKVRDLDIITSKLCHQSSYKMLNKWVTLLK